MSKIYEALRRHEERLADEAMPRHSHGETDLDDERNGDAASTFTDRPRHAEESRFVGRSPVVSNVIGANREMHSLFRSLEPLVAGVQGGAMIMFSSAHPGEGKTTVCGSYAATLAQNFGKSVLILDADRDHVLTRKWGAKRDTTIAALEQSSEAAADVVPEGKRLGVGGSISVMPVGSGNAD